MVAAGKRHFDCVGELGSRGQTLSIGAPELWWCPKFLEDGLPPHNVHEVPEASFRKVIIDFRRDLILVPPVRFVLLATQVEGLKVVLDGPSDIQDELDQGTGVVVDQVETFAHLKVEILNRQQGVLESNSVSIGFEDLSNPLCS